MASSRESSRTDAINAGGVEELSFPILLRVFAMTQTGRRILRRRHMNKILWGYYGDRRDLCPFVDGQWGWKFSFPQIVVDIARISFELVEAGRAPEITKSKLSSVISMWEPSWTFDLGSRHYLTVSIL